MMELSSYAFLPLREGDIALFRGAGNGLAPILTNMRSSPNLTPTGRRDRSR